MAFLVSKGFTPDRAAAACRFALCTAMMLVSFQPGDDTKAAGDETLRRKRQTLASLPADRYPLISTAADAFVSCLDPDANFRDGIEMVLGGIRSQADRA